MASFDHAALFGRERSKRAGWFALDALCFALRFAVQLLTRQASLHDPTVPCEAKVSQIHRYNLPKPST